MYIIDILTFEQWLAIEVNYNEDEICRLWDDPNTRIDYAHYCENEINTPDY